MTLETVRQIPLPLSFYDKLLEKNNLLISRTANMNAVERENFWKKILSVERVGKSSLIRISITDANPMQAELLSKNTALDMAAVAAKYYDIRNDLEIRIFNGPVTGKKTVLDLTEIIIGLCAGFVLGALAFLLFPFLKKTEIQLPRPTFVLPDFSGQFGRTKIEYSQKDEKTNVSLIAPEAKLEPKVMPGKKSAAPENLPVGSEFVVESLKHVAEKEKVSADEKIQEIMTHEATPEQVKARLQQLSGRKSHTATPEEVKERLNRLLNGEM